MDLNEKEALKDIVKVLFHAKGEWRTPGGIARDLGISPVVVNEIVRNNPDFFVISGDENAKFALRPGGQDAVALTDSARSLYHKDSELSF